MATTDVASPGGAAAGGRVPGGNSVSGRTPAGRPPAAPPAGNAAPAGPTGVAKATQFYQDVVAEMKRVTWPARKELQDATVRIIVFVLFIGAMIALMDIALQFLLIRLPQLLLGGGR